MFRKTRLFLSILVLLALMLLPSLASAGRPTPPTDLAAPMPLIPNYEVPQAGQDVPMSEAVRNAVALKESLTLEQQRAMQALLERYLPEFNAIAQRLPAPSGVPAPVADAPEPLERIDAQMAQEIENVQVVQEVILLMEAVRARLDEEMATILTPEQWAMYQGGLLPAQKHLEAAASMAERAPRGFGASADNPRTPQYNSGYCYYAGVYASLAEYYGWVAYVYAYYNYYYNTYGSYNCYYYNEEAEDYTWLGLRDVGGGYYDLITLGTDFNYFVYNAIGHHAYATNYSYYGYVYCANNYSSYGYTYAYYATVLAYYTNNYSYYAYVYDYYCYYS